MEEDREWVVTTPAYYVNARPHIGHFYSNLIATWVSNYLDLTLVSGTDVHGKKIRLAAEGLGVEPSMFAKNLSLHFTNLWARYLAPSRYFLMSTEHPLHKSLVLSNWSSMMGACQLGDYRGWYSYQDEAFLKEGVEGAVWVSERNLFLDLTKYRDRLHQLYSSGVIEIYPSFYLKQVLNQLIDPNLQLLCLTRKEVWGLTSGMKDRTIYVWADALQYYLTSWRITYPKGRVPGWIHVIGKDILTFHAIYWPIILIILGIDFRLKLLVTGWLVADQKKISKRLGNSPLDDLEADEEGLIQVRNLMLSSNLGRDIDIKSSSIQKAHHDYVYKVLNTIHRVFHWASTTDTDYYYRSIRPVGHFRNPTAGLHRAVRWINLCMNSAYVRGMKAPNNPLLSVAYHLATYVSTFDRKVRLYLARNVVRSEHRIRSLPRRGDGLY